MKTKIYSFCSITLSKWYWWRLCDILINSYVFINNLAAIFKKKIIKNTEFRVINSQKLKNNIRYGYPISYNLNCVAIRSEVMFSLTILKQF